jgi:hypothetical protein
MSKTGVFHGFGPVSATFGSIPAATPPFPVRGMFVWVLHRYLAIQFGVLEFVVGVVGSCVWAAAAVVTLLRRFAQCFRTLDGPEQHGTVDQLYIVFVLIRPGRSDDICGCLIGVPCPPTSRWHRDSSRVRHSKLSPPTGIFLTFVLQNNSLEGFVVPAPRACCWCTYCVGPMRRRHTKKSKNQCELFEVWF